MQTIYVLRESKTKVSTIVVCKVGETFEFASQEKLFVGEVIDVGLQYQGAYGKAVVTRDTGYGGYEARRV